MCTNFNHWSEGCWCVCERAIVSSTRSWIPGQKPFWLIKDPTPSRLDHEQTPAISAFSLYPLLGGKEADIFLSLPILLPELPFNAPILPIALHPQSYSHALMKDWRWWSILVLYHALFYRWTEQRPEVDNFLNYWSTINPCNHYWRRSACVNAIKICFWHVGVENFIWKLLTVLLRISHRESLKVMVTPIHMMCISG